MVDILNLSEGQLIGTAQPLSISRLRVGIYEDNAIKDLLPLVEFPKRQPRPLHSINK